MQRPGPEDRTDEISPEPSGPAAVAGELARGERVGERERYEVLECIGRGSSASVYRARDRELGRHVAIKLFAKRLVGPARDGFALARFHHENIVTLYDHGEQAGRPLLVLEHVAGETLQERVARGPLGGAEALAIVTQVAHALVHAHANGVLHRDLKPANILLSRRGQVKVTDFGLAVLTLSGSHLESAFGKPADEIRELIGSSPMLAGTPQYMAPEQWRGMADERSDVFACGELLYELLTGRAPFPVTRRSAPPVLDPTFTAAATDLPPGFAPIIDKALAREPAARFQSAAELLLALSSLERRETRAAAELPYRYLEAFAEADAAWFFGREAETTALQLLLARRPLLAVVGPSGAGKSSLVHAGLVPRLRADRAPWTILAMRPGRDPLHTVCARLGESEGRDAGELRQRPARLGEWLRELAARSGGPVLLVVDQLEELYTHAVDAASRAAFAAGLLAAGDDPDGPVRVVVTVREDFLPRFADSPELEEQLAQNRVFVRPPGRAAMLEALRGPARALGVAFEAGLDEEIVDALADEKTPLPLLELTASRLWERRDERRLGRAALIQLGGVAGVMATHAEEVLAELPAAGDIDVARRIFCELVTADRTRQHREREDLLAGGDREAAARVLEHLLRRRLLTSKQDGPGAARIELPSEALLGGWSRLQGWLDEGLAERVFRERMQQAACLWDERGRPRELLWTGRALDEAAGRDAADLAGASRDFLAASLALRRRRRWALWSGAAGIGVLLVAIAVGSVAGMRVYGAQRDQAREFARLLLFDLRDAVEPLPGSTPVLDKLVSASLAYYRSNVDPDAGDREQRRNLAVAFEKIGEVALRLGRTADALDVEERAVHIHERLVEEAPREDQPVRDLAGGHEKLGTIAAEQGRSDDAERHFARAVELLTRLAEERAGDRDVAHELAISHRQLGELLGRRGRTNDARHSLERAVEIEETLGAADPENAAWQLELALAHQKVGSLEKTAWRVDQAGVHYQRARVLRERLVARDGNNVKWLGALSQSYQLLSDLARQRERLDEARAWANLYLGIAVRLAASDPSNALLQRSLALAQARLGIVARAQRRFADARFHFGVELAVVERIALADPANENWQRDLSLAYSRFGDLALSQGNLDEAAALQERALAIRVRLAEAHPDDLQVQRELAIGIERVAQLAQERQRWDEAAAHYVRVIAILERLSAGHPDMLELQQDVSLACLEQGAIAQAQAKYEVAAGFLERARALAEHLVTLRPGDGKAQHDLADVWARLADLARARGRLDEETALLEKALAIQLALARAAPDDRELQHALAERHLALAEADLSRRDGAAAAASLGQATSILSALDVSAASDPAQIALRRRAGELAAHIAGR